MIINTLSSVLAVEGGIPTISLNDLVILLGVELEDANINVLVNIHRFEVIVS
jgi:hypothetical protein